MKSESSTPKQEERKARKMSAFMRCLRNLSLNLAESTPSGKINMMIIISEKDIDGLFPSTPYSVTFGLGGTGKTEIVSLDDTTSHTLRGIVSHFSTSPYATREPMIGRKDS